MFFIFAEGRDHHDSRKIVCNVAAGSAHRVIHEAQVLGPSNDHNTWPGLEAHCDVIPFPDIVGGAACKRGSPAVQGAIACMVLTPHEAKVLHCNTGSQNLNLCPAVRSEV